MVNKNYCACLTCFFKGRKIVKKTATLHFFESPRKLQREPSKNVNMVFICKVCDIELEYPWNELSNMSKHLKAHELTRTWVEAHSKNSKRFKECEIDEPLFKFVMLFIGTNMPITILKNPLFVDHVNQTVKCPTYDYMRNNILESVLKNSF